MDHTISPIAYIHSPFKEKFATPRQPRIVASATATLHFTGKANHPDALRGIEQFSHLWLLFLFDQNLQKGWSVTVRPPRLGGNERLGVFATRSTFRPNGIGMSAVKLESVQFEGGQLSLTVSGCDLVDGTPIVDIKPYLPYSDAIPEAAAGFAQSEPEIYPVFFSATANAFLQTQPQAAHKYQVICEVLAQDPRPAYKKNKPDPSPYFAALFDLEVQFCVIEKEIHVLTITQKSAAAAHTFKPAN
ncbi:MAG: tRNA (N6-threonylcarbamoyladenosine(37)-N6)-methyltransferase TrmO [Vibrionaceae bacterium]